MCRIYKTDSLNGTWDWSGPRWELIPWQSLKATFRSCFQAPPPPFTVIANFSSCEAFPLLISPLTFLTFLFRHGNSPSAASFGLKAISQRTVTDHWKTSLTLRITGRGGGSRRTSAWLFEWRVTQGAVRRGACSGLTRVISPSSLRKKACWRKAEWLEPLIIGSRW